MRILELVLLLVLLIPILAVLTDSPLGRALARRLEGRTAAPQELTDLAKRVDVLEGEVQDLEGGMASLKEENQFLQRLLEEGGGRPPLPPRSAP
jgi:cell division protein FtsB